jgi:hypothetical protein
MKNMLLAMQMLLLALISISSAQSNPPTKPIQPANETKGWTYPYKADQERTKKILDGAKSIKAKVTFEELVNKLGNPDVIDDLRKSFMGLSPDEDSLLVARRSQLSYRLIWYISKKGALPNLNDIWVTAYIGTDEKTVMGLLGNKIPD